MGALISAPLSMAATCGGSLLGSCCASMACKACSCACTLTQRVSSFVYLGLVYIFLIAAYTFKYQGGPIVIGGSTNATESSILDKMRHAAMDQTVGQISDRWNSNFWCAPRYPTGIIICCEDVCGGDFAVYRFSFTLCLFFASLALLTVGKSRIGATAHRGFWLIKAFVLMGLLVSTLFIENDTLVGYRETARYLSFGFLVMQVRRRLAFSTLPPRPHTRPPLTITPRGGHAVSTPVPQTPPAAADHRLWLHHERDLARIRRGL